MRFSNVPSLQGPLEEEIKKLATFLKEEFDAIAFGSLLIGSCSRGDANYRSDVDILVVLKEGPLKYERVVKLRGAFDSRATLGEPLGYQLNFVLSDVFETEEPAMREALRKAVILVDGKSAHRSNRVHHYYGHQRKLAKDNCFVDSMSR